MRHISWLPGRSYNNLKCLKVVAREAVKKIDEALSLVKIMFKQLLSKKTTRILNTEIPNQMNKKSCVHKIVFFYIQCAAVLSSW
jgi:hypothetical protein